MRVGRQVGRYAASSNAAASTVMDAVNASGSRGLSPYSKLLKRRATATASNNPMASPAIVTPTPIGGHGRSPHLTWGSITPCGAKRATPEESAASSASRMRDPGSEAGRSCDRARRCPSIIPSRKRELRDRSALAWSVLDYPRRGDRLVLPAGAVLPASISLTRCAPNDCGFTTRSLHSSRQSGDDPKELVHVD